MLEYDSRIERERREAERKSIEANGIKQLQETVSASLNDRFLQWRGIDATLELARSPNSKVIVVGGRNGLPLILNPDGAVTAAPTPVPAPSRPPQSAPPR